MHCDTYSKFFVYLLIFFMHVCNLGFTVYTMSHLGLIGTSLGHTKPQWIPKIQPFHTQLFHDHLP